MSAVLVEQNGPVATSTVCTCPDACAVHPGATLFAVIKKSSQYYHQQLFAKRGEGVGGFQPFAVRFSRPLSVSLDHKHCVHGNSNHYRIRDLRFYVRAGDVWVPLS